MREKDIPDSKLYAGKIKRTALSMMKHGYSKDEAIAFISSAKGVTDKDREAVGEWFYENLPKLEGSPEYRAICEDSACCLGGKREAAAKLIRAEEPTVAARVARLLKTPYIIGCCGEVVDEKTFYINFFPTEPKREYYMCSCLRYKQGQQKKPMHDGYCYCCGGHMKHHIETALGVKVDVTLVTSALTTMGRDGCRFRVDIQG